MSMMGYTKLFGSIVASTIWRESKETKIVWITMLALANKNGIVEASIPGLADMARVTIEDCEGALEDLLAADKYSRTKEHEGRRIEAIDGGWSILNHAKYRAKMNADERREYLAQKQREHREKVRQLGVNDSEQSSTESTQPEAYSESKEEIPISDFLVFYSRYPRKVGKEMARKAFAKVKAPLPELLTAIELVSKTDAWKKDGGKFIPYPATWLNGKRWEDEVNPEQSIPSALEGIRMV